MRVEMPRRNFSLKPLVTAYGEVDTIPRFSVEENMVGPNKSIVP
jgi:hypothetical protein